MNGRPVDRIPGAAGLARRTRLALGFLIVALALLLLVPVASQLRVNSILNEFDDIVLPAARLVGAFQVELAHESSWLLLYQITGDERYRDGFLGSVRTGRSLLDRLAATVAEMEPRVHADVAELVRRHESWIRAVESERFLDPEIGPVVFLQRYALVHRRYQDVASATGAVDRGVQRALDARGSALESAAWSRTITTFVLAVLALAAAGVVLWFGRRFGMLAAEIERRRAEAEARRRDLERVTESRARLMRGFSHDLKNPLGAAAGQAALLEGGTFGTLNDAQRESVRRLRASIAAALGLIGDVLDLARAEAGGVELAISRTLARLMSGDLAVESRLSQGSTFTMWLPLPG